MAFFKCHISILIFLKSHLRNFFKKNLRKTIKFFFFIMLFMFFSLFFTNQTQQPRTQTHHKNTNPATKNSNHKKTNQELTHHKNTNPATKTQITITQTQLPRRQELKPISEEHKRKEEKIKLNTNRKYSSCSS